MKTKPQPAPSIPTQKRAEIFQARLRAIAANMQTLRLNPRTEWNKPDNGPIFRNHDDCIDHERAERAQDRLVRSIRIRNYDVTQENGLWIVKPNIPVNP